MEAAGARVLMNYRNLAVMGFVNVVVNIPTVIRNLSLCRSHIKEFNPDVVGITGYINGRDVMIEYARAAKKFNPDITVLIGGVHAEINV